MFEWHLPRRAGLRATPGQAQSERAPRRPAAGRSHSRRVVVSTVVVGLALSIAASLAAERIDRRTEQRLLEVQTEQAASVLAAAVAAIERSLTTALSVDRLGGGDARSLQAAADLLASEVGPDARFVSAALRRMRREPPGGSEATSSKAPRPARVVRVGTAAALNVAGARGGRLTRLALKAGAGNTIVRRVRTGGQTRIGYTQADPTTGLVVYAERAIPANRRAPVDVDSAYSGLDYAIYIGTDTRTSAMTTTNLDPATLPMEEGTSHRTTVPFGDRALLLVTQARQHLGSPLSRSLPLILLLSGMALTLVAAVVAWRLSRARAVAEADTATIRELYDRVDGLFVDQRELFVGLQRALLPRADPGIPHLEVDAEYVAGAVGIDIGGDWYSVVSIDEEHYAFVVGDVSGRGVEAVAEMARARFTLRAYLMDGRSPAAALERCSHQFDITIDGHIVTALVGIGNHRTGHVTVANAGHLPPLLIDAAQTTVVTTDVGPPLGLGTTTYRESTFTLPPSATLICYTDGLIERRAEAIDTGLGRLIDTVTDLMPCSTRHLIDRTIAALRDDAAPDDTAMLVLRRSAQLGD